MAVVGDTMEMTSVVGKIAAVVALVMYEVHFWVLPQAKK